MPRKIDKLIEGATSTEDGDQVVVDGLARTYQGIVAGTGAVTATIEIEGSNDSKVSGAEWVSLGTITLSGTTSDTDGFGSVLPWLMVRARLTAITGTGATVNVLMGS